MRAAVASVFDSDNPVVGLKVGEHEGKAHPDGWVRVNIRAAALNHHDVWTLRGVATPEANLPIVLGSDGAGVTDDGREVIVHAVIGDGSAHGGDETLDPRRSLLSEVHDGTLATEVWVPERNLVAKPPWLSFEEAACLPTAWLTAYRMLFTKAQVTSGDTVLIQGAGGGVASALISLASAAGATVWVTSGSQDKLEYAKSLGAAEGFAHGAKLPGKVDAVMESVGEATWAHSLRSLRPGGRVVVCGATSGPNPPSDLNRVFFLQLQVLGSTMGTRDEFDQLLAFMERTGVRPHVQFNYALDDIAAAIDLMATGGIQGKLVVTP